jgi:DNA-directed RNA polymerase subunit M/transcription elongation factor TFIIS
MAVRVRAYYKISETYKNTLWKNVACEHCGAKYGYEMTREYTDHSEVNVSRSEYNNIVEAESERNASAKRAKDHVEKELAAGEAVWCPKCGKYQAAMVGMVQADSAAGLHGSIILLYLASLLVLAGYWYKYGFPWTGLPVVTGLVVIAHVVVWIRSRLSDVQAEARTRVTQGGGKGILFEETYRTSELGIAEHVVDAR